MSVGGGGIQDRNQAYWRARARPAGAVLVLREILQEMLPHVGAEQARALCYAAGVRIAAAHSLGRLERLADLEAAAQRFLSEQDWGWLAIEEHQDAVDFLHGCSPLQAWFGEAGNAWAPALFEGLYTEWLRQLGAGDRLELRQVAGAGAADGVLVFRLMHESRFKA